MNPFWEKGEPIERNFEPILKLYQNWLSFTNQYNPNQILVTSEWFGFTFMLK